MRHPERVPDYLQHIVVACNRVRAFSEGKTEAIFHSDLMTQDAILRAAHVIGEACGRIRRADPDFIEANGLSAFFYAIGFRNRIAHEYDDFELKIAWTAVVGSIPALRQQVIDLLHALGHHPDPDSLHF